MAGCKREKLLVLAAFESNSDKAASVGVSQREVFVLNSLVGVAVAPLR